MVLFDKYVTEQEEIITNRSMTTLKVQMIGVGNVSIQGTLNGTVSDSVPENFNNLIGISDADFAITHVINAEGTYSYDVTGMSAIKIKKSAKDLKVKIVGVE